MSTRERRASCLGERLLDRSKSRLMLATFALAGMLVAAGCGSSTRATPKQTPTPTPTGAPATSPTPDASDAAVLAAYQAYIAAVNQANAASSGPGSWNVPALSATMVNPLLQEWQSQLIQEDGQGITVTGTFTPEHPRVVANSGTAATVSDCVWDATVEYYKASNGGTPEAVPNQPGGTQPEGDGVQVAFTLVAGKWMASGEPSDEVGNCTGF